MREEIFKPFIQYKTGTLRSVPGTGIGLALARSLAELHEGTLCMKIDGEQLFPAVTSVEARADGGYGA